MYIIHIYITRNLNINNQPCLPEMNRKLIPDPNPSNRLSQPRLHRLRDSCNQKKAVLCCWSWQLEWAIEQFKFRSCKCYRNLTWWKSEEQVLDMKCVNMILRYNCNTTTDLAQVLKLTLERPFWMFPENQSAVMMIHFCNCGDDDPFYCRVKKVDHHHRSHKSGSSSPQFGFYAFGNLKDAECFGWEAGRCSVALGIVHQNGLRPWPCSGSTTSRLAALAASQPWLPSIWSHRDHMDGRDAFCAETTRQLIFLPV